MRSRFGQRPLYKRAFCSPRATCGGFIQHAMTLFLKSGGFNADSRGQVNSTPAPEKREIVEKKIAKSRRLNGGQSPPPITIGARFYAAARTRSGKRKKQSSPSESRIPRNELVHQLLERGTRNAYDISDILLTGKT